MKFVSRRLFWGLCSFAVGLGLAACAGSIPSVDPVDIPRLQQEVAADPGDTDLQVQLGMAQFKAEDYETARASLQGAVDAGNRSGPAYLYLGFVQEELEDWSAARQAYNRYLVVGTSSQAQDEVRTRLTMIGRNLLRAQAQQALAQEQEITATGMITPQSVAVMPMGFNSDRDDLEPLIYALSDMMITDFKFSNALVVLERTQVQTLLDEMALTTSGYADAATGARAGRMLRAEYVFQGVLTTLGDDDLQAQADILDIPSTASAGQLTESAILEQIFDMEKAIVIRTIREVLGVTLTPAEEQRILDNRMDNVLAFLAFGRGLRELDNGNYEAAQQEFDVAKSLDPGYFGVDVASAEASALIDAAAVNTVALDGIATATGETGGSLIAPPPATTIQNLADIGISPQAPIGAGSDPQEDVTIDPVSGEVTTTTTDPATGEVTTRSIDPSTGQTTITTSTTTTSTTIQTLTNVFEGIDPTPTTTTLGVSTSDQIQNPTSTQTQPTTREPVQEGQNQETVPGTAQAQIRIVIRRPGGEQ
jgi:Tfp pilus assembly protein PilF/TolB-like protein